MYKNAKRGWYRLLNPQKFIKQQDKHMKSVNEGKDFIEVEYKSSLEHSAIRYADYNKHIKYFGLEPFAIPYLKPTDAKIHRYFIDLFLEFVNGQKFLVEIKSYNETIPPKKPKSKSQKALISYKKALETFAVNTAKWDAAKKWAEERGIKFIILTENELK